MIKRVSFSFAMVAGFLLSLTAAERGDVAVVVFNKNSADSKKLAERYAKVRGVPAEQLFGVDVDPGAVGISRPEFRNKIEKPLFDWLTQAPRLSREQTWFQTPPVARGWPRSIRMPKLPARNDRPRRSARAGFRRFPQCAVIR